MKSFYISFLLSVFISTSFHKGIQGQVPASQNDQKRLAALTPTLKEIMTVDAKQMPWGVNLSLVEKRGQEARTQSLDKYDFSSRITLYQKHKTKAKKLALEYKDLLAKRDPINAEAEKQLDELKNVNPLKRIGMKKKVEQNRKDRLQEVEKTIVDKKNELERNATSMKNLGATIMKQTGLKPEQIAKLPDYETWKTRKTSDGL